jgi:hypothetical protein
MVMSFIKNFSIIICSLYTYAKLLNLQKTSKNKILDLAFAAALSLSICYLRLNHPLLTVPLMIPFSYIFMTITTKTELGLSITTTIISFGISHVFLAISALFVAIIFELIGINLSSDNAGIVFIYVALVQLSLIGIPFRFRRLKSGMPFLRSKGGSNIGVFISVALLCSVIIFSRGNNTGLIYVLPVVLIFLSGALILFWWRNRLNKVYIEKLRTSEIQVLRNAISENEAQIEQLRQHNDFLAKVIHRDNKLLPAMELAVSEYLQSFVQREGGDTLAKGQMLLKQLKTVSCERSGIIEEYQSASKKLPLANVISVDALMVYLFNKAQTDNTEFELTIYGSVKYLVENIISESDLNTLLADLIENAMIATRNSDSKRILVSISISEGHYLIDVFDSGIPFEAETIVNLGLKKITTHADNGGSGIGLITAFEIFKKYNTSFIIEEFADKSSIYTKKLSVVFDNQNQYIIKTARNFEIKAISQREDMLVTV